ncbi:hypothetical protein AS034_03080 [[Bacillus] enclensis]|uniref:DUF1033 domain-containing protein n=1 Tax=[Bacillus] enclensis TaxID=1402860 RepID=A0A0V8HKT4_9BACI|nr:DUF1033 family protein [[Bacillus] enclensis]KSU63251.1 hypothetical protein AS034_03080 [[Bacillus] enclensis]MBH9964731.1 DUF1033 family protein [[Bacillus] enclensis]QWC21279.1 DUF1033 family protein [Bacillus haikouensis]SCB80810.1 hypothetical protein GA0061094_0639 [[Bacillus] enclensis]
MEPIRKVILTRSDAEPWWFFEDWQKDIVQTWEYVEESAAVEKYKTEISRLRNIFPNVKTKNYQSIAFWNPEELEFCEACDDDAQIYHGIILFEDEQPMEIDEEMMEEIKGLLAGG